MIDNEIDFLKDRIKFLEEDNHELTDVRQSICLTIFKEEDPKVMVEAIQKILNHDPEFMDETRTIKSMSLFGKMICGLLHSEQISIKFNGGFTLDTFKALQDALENIKKELEPRNDY